MKELIAALISSTRADSKGLDFGTVFEPLVALGKQIELDHARWLTYGDAVQAVFMYLSEAVGTNKSAAKEPVPLPDLIGADKCQQLEADILNFLGSLPRKYEFYFSLPAAGDAGSESVEVAPGIFLVTVEDTAHFEHLRAVATTTLGGLLSGARVPRFAPTTTHIRVVARGYFSGTHDSSASVDAISRLKQLTALAIANGAWENNSALDPTSIAAEAVVLDTASGSAQQFELPTAVAQTLNSLQFAPDVHSPRNNLLTALDAISAKSKTAYAREDVPPRLIKRFGVIGHILAQKPSDIDTRSIRTAAEWAFDSWAEDNQTLALLFASIGFEAILQSNRDERSDTIERLADRLAYLLGTSRKSRSALGDEFREFYKVRGQIVHGRSSRLEREQVEWLHWGQKTLREVIAREMRAVGPAA